MSAVPQVIGGSERREGSKDPDARSAEGRRRLPGEGRSKVWGSHPEERRPISPKTSNVSGSHPDERRPSGPEQSEVGTEGSLTGTAEVDRGLVPRAEPRLYLYGSALVIILYGCFSV